MLEINQSYPCKVGYYGAKRNTSKIKYIVMHYTGNVKDTAISNAKYFHTSINRQASAHYFVDETSIYQSVQDNYVAWSVGGKPQSTFHPLYQICTNSNSISIEMCTSGDSEVSDKTINNAIELVKYLMNKYGIDANHVTNHYHCNGKACPSASLRTGERWNSFINRLGGSVQEVTTVSPTPTAKAKSYLSNGDKGIAVKTMQTMLIAVGYSCGKYGADSSFGTGTTNALKKFQKAYGLTVDGKYGNKSKAKLESVYNAKKTQTTKKSNDDWVNRLNAEIKVQGFSTYPLVKRGAKGNITKLIQERLVSVGFSLKIDGDFGETTEAKVKKFQSNRGLKADGKVGEKTWEWLISGKSV